MEQKPERITKWMAVLLILFAISTDVSEEIITWLGFVKIGGIVSMVISFISGFTYWLWYLILGIPAVANPKQFAVRASTFMIEIIPFLDVVPLISWGWTIGTIITVMMIRSEDKGGIIGKASQMIPGK